MRCLVLSLALLLAAPRTAQATERLIQVAKLWGLVRFHHPRAAERSAAWDAKLIELLPRVRSARSAGEYQAVVRELLAVLGDPVTQVRRVPVRKPPPATVRLEDGILVIVFGDYTKDYELYLWGLAGPPPELGRARGVIFDLRGALPVDAWAGLGPAVVGAPVPLPAERHRVHEGYAPESGVHDMYFSALVAKDGEVVQPHASARRALPVVFLTDQAVGLPRLAAGLQAAGQASVVVEGVPGSSVAAHVTMPLGDGLEAVVRIGEPDRDVAIDAVVARGRGLEAARSLLASPARRSSSPVPPAGAAVSGSPHCRPEQPLTPEVRRYAAIKLWNVIHYFYPYKDLLGDWDAVLPVMLERFAAAADLDAYTLAVLELSTRVADSHVRVLGPSAERLLPEPPRLDLQVVDGALVFRRDHGSAKAGDVVVEVAGEPIAGRLARLGKLVAASTPQAHALATALRAVGHAKTVRVRGRDGTVRDAALAEPAQPTEEPVRLVAPGIGYADLRRLTAADVDGAFARLAATKAIVFDMRGYPTVEMGELVRHLVAPGAAPINARSAVPLVRLGQAPGARVVTTHRLSPGSGPRYRGKTVMLVDERAGSLAEGSAMVLRAAHGTRLVGSPTQGVIGDFTDLCLPGPLLFRFTGRDIHWPDGRPLQRVGLIPDLAVRPTLRGIQEGRDEVLERAVAGLLAGSL